METKFLSNTQVAAINEIANRINEVIKSDFDNTQVAKIFVDVIDLKKGIENEEQKREVTKYFFSLFDNLTTVRIKVATKINENKVTATSETMKSIDNVLSKSIEEQRKGVKTMLKNAVARNKNNKHNLHFSASAYLTNFDLLTDNEFCTLYKGATTIKVENVISLITKKLIEQEKENNK